MQTSFEKWFNESDGEEEEYRRDAFFAGWRARKLEEFKVLYGEGLAL